MRKSDIVAILSLSILSAALISGCDKNEQGGKTAATAVARCNVEAINGAALAVTNIMMPSTLTISGWVVNERDGTVPSEVSIELVSADGKERVTGAASRGTKRPDVAKYFNKPAFEGAGFVGWVNIDKVTPGRYNIKIMQGSGATSLTCDSDKAIEIR